MASSALDMTVRGDNIEKIASLMDKDPIIRMKWSVLAHKLGIELHTIKKLRDDEFLNKLLRADIIREILYLWVAHTGKSANLGILIEKVELLGAVNVGEALRIMNGPIPSTGTREAVDDPDGKVKLLQTELAKVTGELQALKEKSTGGNNEDTPAYIELRRDLISMKNLIETKSFEYGSLTEKLKIMDKENRGLRSTIDKLLQENGELKRALVTDNELKIRSSVHPKMSRSLNENGDTDLHIAVDQQDEKAVENLVVNGASLNATNSQLQTPLHRAANIIDKLVSLRLITYLIEEGADVNAKDVGNRIFLHDLVGEGTTLTPSQFHLIVSYLGSYNMTYLFNTPGGTFGHTPFQVAVKNIPVKTQTLLMLHNRGVNFKVLDIKGNSVLAFAISGKSVMVLVHNLVELGLDPFHLNRDKQSLLHFAAQCCHTEALNYFRGKGLDINSQDCDGDTPLHQALMFGKGDVLKTVRVLVENGANVKIKNNNKLTPLEIALNRNDILGKESVVQLLLSDI